MASSDGGVPGGTGPPNGRVAEIIVERAAGKDSRGSGYLFSSGRVLTCAHVLDGATGISVRFDAGTSRERKYEASKAWDHTGVDVAVLTVPAEEAAPESFAGIGPHVVRLECSAKGFPLFKLRRPESGPYRELEEAGATCSPHANSRSQTLELKLHHPPSETVDPRAKPADPYEPWQGMSGAAVFSGGRIVGVVVEHHPAEGGRLTATRADTWHQHLSEDELADLEERLGCGSLRPGRLPDVLAGIRPLPKGVRTHDQELAKPSNRGKYLTDEQIPFVSPGRGHEADPEQLLRRLTALSAPGASSDSLGVVLVGAAGSGKTRTCFEVAARAGEAGWSVLHVEPDESAPEGLADAVSKLNARGEDVLLVIDYLDTYRQLDLVDFNDQVKEGRSTQARLACIASLRHGAVHGAQGDGKLRGFEQVRLSQEESHQSAVARSIVERVAEQAVAAYDVERVAAVCGSRPVLALLIARAIESRVRAREPDVLDRPGLRNDGDLSHWLRRRTGEHLADERSDLVASAVAAASCGQHRDAVQESVAAFLENHPDADFDEISVVGQLIDLGWLLETGDGVDVLHDFVADELLQQALLPKGSRLEGALARRMFTAFLVSHRTFRLAADHVRRWSADLDRAKQDDVERTCTKWLTAQGGPAPAPSERLAAERDLAEYGRTLLTLLSGAPWQSGTVRVWDRLVRPWLERAAAEAPHLPPKLLTDAVRNTSEAVPERLSGAALEWLAAAPRPQYESRTVLEALLRAAHVCGAHRVEAARRTVEWFRTHGVTWGCRFLLAALLTRDDLPDDVADQAVEKGLVWLARSHGTEEAAKRLLGPLLKLGRRDGGPECAAALRWLGVAANLATEDASFVLHPLLRHPALGAHGPHSPHGLQGPGPRAEHPQADDRRTDGASKCAAARFALAWLERHRSSAHESFVLDPLLSLRELSEDDAGRAVELALPWLDSNAPLPQARFVLKPVLRADRAGVRAAPHALRWLRAHATTGTASFVLPALLECPGLDEDSAAEAVSHALDWLDAHHPDPPDGEPRVLKPLPRCPLPDPELRSRAVQRILDCADAGHTALSGEDLRHLCRLGPLPLDSGTRLARHTTEWVRDHPSIGSAGMLAAPLWRQDIRPAQVRALVDLTLELLALDSHLKSVGGRLLRPLLARADVDPDRRFEAVSRALHWLEPRAGTPFAGALLAPLLRIQSPGSAGGGESGPHGGGASGGAAGPAAGAVPRAGAVPAADLVGMAFAWLAEHPTHPYAAEVLSALLVRPGLTPPQASSCAEFAADWLKAPGNSDLPAAAELSGLLNGG